MTERTAAETGDDQGDQSGTFQSLADPPLNIIWNRLFSLLPLVWFYSWPGLILVGNSQQPAADHADEHSDVPGADDVQEVRMESSSAMVMSAKEARAIRITAAGWGTWRPERWADLFLDQQVVVVVALGLSTPSDVLGLGRIVILGSPAAHQDPGQQIRDQGANNTPQDDQAQVSAQQTDTAGMPGVGGTME